MAVSSWQNYAAEFLKLLAHAKMQGAQILVTDDLDMPEDHCWHEHISQK